MSGELLSRCDGVETRSITHTNHSGEDYQRITYHQIGDIVVPDDVYIRINATATVGTIGKLVDLEVDVYSDNKIGEYDMTYIIQIEGKKGTNRIIQYHADILKNHDGSTKWVRNINKKVKEIIPPHVNKYNQSLHLGEWCAGIGPCKTLYFGEITRWSKSSVWVNPTPSIPGSKENCISMARETLVLPAGIDYEQTVTMMALSGWRR